MFSLHLLSALWVTYLFWLALEIKLDNCVIFFWLPFLQNVMETQPKSLIKFAHQIIHSILRRYWTANYVIIRSNIHLLRLLYYAICISLIIWVHSTTFPFTLKSIFNHYVSSLMKNYNELDYLLRSLLLLLKEYVFTVSFGSSRC